MPVTSTASGKGRRLGMGEWGDTDLVQDVGVTSWPPAAMIVNDWFWGGGPLDPVMIPWTWLGMPTAVRTNAPYNRMTVSYAGGTVVAQAPTTTRGALQGETTLATDYGDDARALARWLVAYYATPLVRMPEVRLPLAPRVAWERWRILGVEIGTRVKLDVGAFVDPVTGAVTVLPVPASLPACLRSFVVEGISVEAAIESCDVLWSTSPPLGTVANSATEGPWFMLDYSQLDSGTIMPA
jgi:hypothetical protein